MAFARWDPLRDLITLQERLASLSTGEAQGWMPPVDLSETADQYVLIAEVPGLAREAIQIQLQDGRLILSGERSEASGRHEQYHRVERGHGRFSRSFDLPTAIDIDRVAADLRDGVLTITIPKAGEAEPRRIRVT